MFSWDLSRFWYGFWLLKLAVENQAENKNTSQVSFRIGSNISLHEGILTVKY